MKVVTNLQTLISMGYHTFMLIDARDYETLGMRNKYPKENIYSKDFGSYMSSDTCDSKCDNVAVLFPVKSHLYDGIARGDSMFMTTEYIGGVA